MKIKNLRTIILHAIKFVLKNAQFVMGSTQMTCNQMVGFCIILAFINFGPAERWGKFKVSWNQLFLEILNSGEIFIPTSVYNSLYCVHSNVLMFCFQTNNSFIHNLLGNMTNEMKCMIS